MMAAAWQAAAIGLALAGFAAAAVLAFRSPRLCTLVLVTVVPASAGLARGLPVPGLKLSEALTVGCAGLLLLSADHRTRFSLGFLDVAALTFAAGHLLLPLWSSVEVRSAVSVQDLGVLAWPAQAFLYYRALCVGLQDEGMRDRAGALAIYASVPVTLLTLAQMAGVPGVSGAVGTIVGRTDPATFESGAADLNIEAAPAGPFPHPQVLAAYLAPVIVLGISVLVRRQSHRRRRAVAGCAALALLTLLLTLKSAPLLGVVAGTFVVVCLSPRRHALLPRLAVGLVALAVVASPLLLERVRQQSTVVQGTFAADRNPLVPQTFAFRMDVWRNQALPLIDGRPFSGYGPRLPVAVNWQYSESMYIQLLLRGGVPLLLLWVGLMIGFVRLGYQGSRSEDDNVAALGSFVAAYAVILVPMQVVQPYMNYGGGTHLLWFGAAGATAALSAARASTYRPARREAPTQ